MFDLDKVQYAIFRWALLIFFVLGLLRLIHGELHW
jgi:hypothetical protein